MPPDTTRLTPSELLTAAADFIEQHGWTQGMEQNDDGAVCTLMAVRLAGLGRTTAAVRADAERALKDIALELYGRPVSVPVFNDLGCIDQADALAWMQKATAKLQEQGK